MSDGSRPCQACTHYKTMGDKGFCFKHSKILSSADPACHDFSLKTQKEGKKRFILDKQDERPQGAPLETETIEEPETQEGTDKTGLRQKSRVKSRIFVDAPSKQTNITNIQLKEEDFDQGQNLFLAIMIGGFIILVIVLFASGVL